MKNYRFDDEFVTRIAAFLDSPEYGVQIEFSKSDYWKNHSELFDLKIHDNNISFTGSSGFYVRNVNYLGKAIKSPKAALKKTFVGWRVGLCNVSVCAVSDALLVKR